METVKDKMTYGQAKLIYNDANAKHALSDEQKAAIAKILADAREQAIVAGSAADKHRIFNQALAQVNAYLAAQAVPPAPPAQPKAPAPAVETPGP
jgi:predicted polyphosphate/ATP-dependent NAD kinase